MTWNLIQLFVNFFQMFVIYKVLDMFYERRFYFKYSVELVIGATTVFLSIINYNYAIGTNPKLYLGFYFFLVVLNIIIFRGNPVSKLVTFFLMVALIGVSELVSASLIWLITDIDINSINERSFGRLFAVIISQTIIMFTYMILKKRTNKEKMNLKNNSYYLMVGSIMFFTVAIIITVIGMYGRFPSNENLTLHLVLLTMCVSLLSMLSIALTTKIINDMEEKHKLDLELQHVKLEQKYFSDVNNALEEIRILRHDMRGELAIIHGYNELNQRDKIRNHIEKKLTDMDVQLIPQIDNDNVITSFLNFKCKEAQAKDISLEIQGNISKENVIYIDKEDICRILNNILNNAIDACKECDEKYINLLFSVVNDYIIIKSENPFKGNILNEGGIIQTIKRDKTKHGYGLKSIKSIAEKYNGFMNINYYDNVFKVEVQILNKK